MNGFQAKVGQCKFLALCQSFEDLWIEVANRIDRWPSWTRNMSRMQYSDRKIIFSGLGEEQLLNLGFFYDIVSEGISWLAFNCRNLDAISVNPDCAAHEKLLYLSTEGLHEEPCTIRLKTD